MSRPVLSARAHQLVIANLSAGILLADLAYIVASCVKILSTLSLASPNSIRVFSL